ncbi:hypothetical protein SARC_00557 [Sphaeroforma arctica JP610]|uniref:J domain-containing protein n=1 Tax=Sphaeroforma arctica JP610 TaxID=667725 RepID=A0A0L0GE77_9EUKA|nr:hypothetical protein SARC_00557 [Sphaeroforma arctica JP610]KNC87315.1 hypothetical protein SARC_00557 [Sphaeroforma arctica JP610]|eukprot:XP_014161217.1 hypothetical protein SARC_00557 [Sphaeroforma arctica JP610]
MSGAVKNEEARWTRSERNTIIAQIRLRDISVPLYNHCGIICTANNEDDMTVIKKKIRKAMLRWHPDKFINNFGSKFFEPERDDIIKEVNRVSHMVNKDKERLENTSYAGNFPWRYRYR